MFAVCLYVFWRFELSVGLFLGFWWWLGTATPLWLGGLGLGTDAVFWVLCFVLKLWLTHLLSLYFGCLVGLMVRNGYCPWSLYCIRTDTILGLCIVSEQIPSLVFLAYCWPCYHSCVNPICPSLVTHSVALCCLQLHLLFLFQHKLSAVLLLLCFSLSTMLVASCYCLGKIDYLMLITWVKQLLVFSCLKHNSIYSFFGLKSGRFRCIVGLKTVGLIHCLLLEKNDANPDFPLHTSFCEPTTKVIVICNRRIWPMTELLSSEALAITWFLPKRLMMMFWPKKNLW